MCGDRMEAKMSIAHAVLPVKECQQSVRQECDSGRPVDGQPGQQPNGVRHLSRPPVKRSFPSSSSSTGDHLPLSWKIVEDGSLMSALCLVETHRSTQPQWSIELCPVAPPRVTYTMSDDSCHGPPQHRQRTDQSCVCHGISRGKSLQEPHNGMPPHRTHRRSRAAGRSIYWRNHVVTVAVSQTPRTKRCRVSPRDSKGRPLTSSSLCWRSSCPSSSLYRNSSRTRSRSRSREDIVSVVSRHGHHNAAGTPRGVFKSHADRGSGPCPRTRAKCVGWRRIRPSPGSLFTLVRI